MTLNKYQRLAARTINPKLTKPQTEQHALYGLAGEVGEVVSLYQKELQGHDIRRKDLVNELGDVLWMVAELATTSGITLDEIANYNITKLIKRYPEGFDEERSKHREGETNA